MDNSRKYRFNDLTNKNAERIISLLCSRVQEQFGSERVDDDTYIYSIAIGGNCFNTQMNSKELRQSAETALEFMECLKYVNNTQTGKEELSKAEEVYAYDDDTDDKRPYIFGICKCFNRSNISLLIESAIEIKKIRDCWARQYVRDYLYCVLYSVFKRIVDVFDDEELYIWGAYILLISIMQIYSDTELIRNDAQWIRTLKADENSNP